ISPASARGRPKSRRVASAGWIRDRRPPTREHVAAGAGFSLGRGGIVPLAGLVAASSRDLRERAPREPRTPPHHPLRACALRRCARTQTGIPCTQENAITN